MEHLLEKSHLQEGKYEIVRFINNGGFGCTYEARHTIMGTRVAIKEFFVKDFCSRSDDNSSVYCSTKSKEDLFIKLKKKFLDEAKSIFSMEHPNIVRVMDLFEENGTAYYVMSYIEGQSLSKIVNERGALPESRALRYMEQVVSALSYVHSLNRLHLDIKPANIMINARDEAVLIDFGASKLYDEKTGENASTLLGSTPGYTPLEQLGNNVSYFAPETDIYAVGATLYKIVTSLTPPVSTLLASGEMQLNFPSNISQATRNLIIKAMGIKRKDRFSTAQVFLSNIQSCLDSIDSESTMLSSPTGEIPQSNPVVRAEVMSKGNEQNLNNAPKNNNKKLTYILVAVIFVLALVVTCLAVFTITKNNITSNKEEIQSSSQAIGNKKTASDETASVSDSVSETEVSPNNETVQQSAYTAHKSYTTPSHRVDLGIGVDWCDSNEGTIRAEGQGTLFGIDDMLYSHPFGADWRLPTYSEALDLLNNCTWKWKVHNGTYGYEVEGPNGNAMFLPAPNGIGTLWVADGYCIYFDSQTKRLEQADEGIIRPARVVYGY